MTTFRSDNPHRARPPGLAVAPRRAQAPSPNVKNRPSNQVNTLTDINKAKDFKYTGQLQYKMGDGQTGRISPSDGYEHCIAEFNVSFLDSSRGKDGDWAMVKKLEKHIEDRREQIIEYREKQLLTRPKKNFFSFR